MRRNPTAVMDRLFNIVFMDNLATSGERDTFGAWKIAETYQHPDAREAIRTSLGQQFGVQLKFEDGNFVAQTFNDLAREIANAGEE